MSRSTDRLVNELKEINDRGFHHADAVSERLSFIAEVLIMILLWTEPSE